MKTLRVGLTKLQLFQIRSIDLSLSLGQVSGCVFDALHPAVLAEKYDRNYRPYFIGQRGAASLNQYLGMQQMLPELQNGTAVYVLSPQWFTKRGIILQLFSSSTITTNLVVS